MRADVIFGNMRRAYDMLVGRPCAGEMVEQALQDNHAQASNITSCMRLSIPELTSPQLGQCLEIHICIAWKKSYSCSCLCQKSACVAMKPTAHHRCFFRRNVLEQVKGSLVADAFVLQQIPYVQTCFSEACGVDSCPTFVPQYHVYFARLVCGNDHVDCFPPVRVPALCMCHVIASCI
jgi:hypothetical protein